MTALQVFVGIAIIILLYSLLRYLFYDPYTLQTVQDAKIESVISAKDLATDGTSKAAATNFAYSVWFFVQDWNYRYGEDKILFRRTGSASTGTASIQPGPLVFFDKRDNAIQIQLSCATDASQYMTHTCRVANIPIQKWVHLVVSVNGRSLDVYVDGKLVKTCLMPGVANVATSDVSLTPGGGFAGITAKFQYYPQPLNPQEVWDLYAKGFTNWWSNLSSYNVQVAVLENGNPRSQWTF